MLICIPMFNEASTIRDLLRGLRVVTDADILIVDDGSTDGSSTAVEGSGIRLPHYVRHRRNLGPGFALRTGFRFALRQGYDVLITIDADGQHLPQDVPRLHEALADADVVSGSRFHPRSPRSGTPPPWRLAANQALAQMIGQHTDYAITDGACGLRAYRASALSHLRITEPGYMWPCQLWGQMARAHLAVSEVPVAMIYGEREHTHPLGSKMDSKALERTVVACERILLRDLQGRFSLAQFLRGVYQDLRSVPWKNVEGF